MSPSTSRSLPVLPEPTPETMPATRGDCLPGGVNAARPCPWLTCRYALAAEGSPGACALDLADRGGATLAEIAELLRLTRERVRQLEARALAKVRRKASSRAAHAGLRELALLPDAAPVSVPGRR